MELKEINQILSALDEYTLRKTYKVIQTTNNGYGEERDQSEEGTKTVIYDIGKEVFLKVVFTSDSYGSESGITSIQFVTAKKKEVLTYDSI